MADLGTLAPWLAAGAGLVILYVLLRLITNPLFWTIAAVGVVVFGFTTGWRPETLVVLAAVLGIRWFVRGPSARSVPREFAQMKDPWGRPSDDPYFYKGPPGPRTGYR